ncbi:putative Response regulator receiver modulated diguanylate cyclase/phosphodiesterase [Thiocapsa sp. KS1]|nr:response regulator [Thiocapsa sp. KS1]CRI66569.1 putative Response regulator receiver modulated diguanylate cyclase/phosphodiesterase [Thiocapsa sp. KS1]
MNQTIADDGSAPVIQLLTRNAELTTSLRALLLGRGFRLETFETPERLTDARPSPPALLLVDLDALPDEGTLGVLVAQAQQDDAEPIPLICLASGSDIRSRLAAMRAGAKAYLQMPMEAEELTDRLLDVACTQAASPDRVLVVDDQPVAALFAARVLESAGMLAERVGDPLAVLDALDAFVPDLVLMDLHMPGASGIELTRIIRDQDRFADLPIVFLSAELDAEQQMAALRVGGDDFLAKPVAPDHLVACVRQRLAHARERARRQGGPDAVDALTGLANLERLLRRLGQLIGRGGADADRRALVVLDLGGDEAALIRLAVAVGASCGAGDLAARVGERSLAVLIRRDDAASLARACGQLTEELSRAGFASTPGSALGIGWCTLASSGGDAVTLMSRAAKAARSARKAGDGRPVGYGRDPVPARTSDQDAVSTAILTERLQLLFEPMVSLIPAPSARYEVSPRLTTPDGELLSPVAFMPIAQRCGLVERLDAWLLGKGLDALVACRDAGQPAQLFLYQSLVGAGRGDWIDQVRDEINRRDLFCLRPVIQFQVDEAAADTALAADRVARLARLGIPVCLNGVDADDASERVLASVPAAFARLSRTLVQSLDAEPLAELVQRLRERRLAVIAGGVDAPETIARLCRAGVDLLQGPFVQPPSAVMDYDFSGVDES